MGDRGPISTCLEKHGSNSTLAFHECMCNYDYSYSRNRVKALKMRHCHEAAEMYKIEGFYSYIIIAAAIFFGIIAIIAAFCSCKWYFRTNKNPCKCFSFFCCCNMKRRKPKLDKSDSVNVFEQAETGHTWSPVNLPPLREGEIGSTAPLDDSREDGTCMNFCLSDPVQDCCEFFDCDIMWRKKSVYTIPIFGKKKPQQQQHHQHLQRRPSRPAPAPPPPPYAVVFPQPKPKYHEPQMLDDSECEPVPEAPPSPEPVRTIHPKALYVDPLAFLQRPFLKMTTEKNETEDDSKNDKQEALYSRFKNMVLSKVKKSVSTASINKLGVSDNPDGSGPDGRKLKTASLASLNNLPEGQMDASYGSKRSLSLASLTMLYDEAAVAAGNFSDPRSRISVISSATADDIPPDARKDEYIDLEEMSKRIEAKMRATPQPLSRATTPHRSVDSPIKSSGNYTPNFIPASAFSPAIYSNNSHYESYPNQNHEIREDNLLPGNYYPPVPASQGKPAVPARTSIGAPIYSVSSGTMGRPKPAIPPRPPNVSRNGMSSPGPSHLSSNPATLTRSPRLVKPSGPPPPPPTSRAPIESSI